MEKGKRKRKEKEKEKEKEKMRKDIDSGSTLRGRRGRRERGRRLTSFRFLSASTHQCGSMPSQRTLTRH